MKALIWLFFLVAILMVMRWYLNNRNATGAFDSTTGRFAMRDELNTQINQVITKTGRSDSN